MKREDEEICGETIEHDLDEVSSGDGETTYMCRRCDAEIVEAAKEKK